MQKIKQKFLITGTFALIAMNFHLAVAQNTAQTITQATVSSAASPLSIYQKRQEATTPQQILDWLQKGNERFAKGKSNHGGFPVDARERIKVSAVSQRPLAAVLSCIDSRTTPELVFDTSVGDLFTARVGANVINEDILGSLEIAVNSGAKVLVVLGHTDCGGIKGACSHLQLGHMTQLLDRIQPVITAVNSHLDKDPAFAKEIGERVVGNRRYIAEVSHMNTLQSTKQILAQSSVLSEKVKSREIILISGIYDVDSGKVIFDPQQ